MKTYMEYTNAWRQNHKGSDIDIAVSGLLPKFFFRALVEVEELINEKVDIKSIEEYRGLIKDHIDK